MQTFPANWHEAAYTTLGLFWMAFWAFGLGYLISSMIQVFITRERMKKSMGETGAASVGLGTFFGFISSSCSFAALATTRSLFAKGAGLVPSLAFLLASTNLVIELGIVIAVLSTTCVLPSACRCNHALKSAWRPTIFLRGNWGLALPV